MKNATKAAFLVAALCLPASASAAKEPPSTWVHVVGDSAPQDAQCVLFVRHQTGNPEIRGDAGKLQPEGDEPRVGAAALDATHPHVSVVVAIDGEYIVVRDTNWRPGKVTERRVRREDERGYIYSD